MSNKINGLLKTHAIKQMSFKIKTVKKVDLLSIFHLLLQQNHNLSSTLYTTLFLHYIIFQHNIYIALSHNGKPNTWSVYGYLHYACQSFTSSTLVLNYALGILSNVITSFYKIWFNTCQGSNVGYTAIIIQEQSEFGV